MSLFVLTKRGGHESMALVISEQITQMTLVSHSEHDVSRINSINSKYPKERSKSKAPTFALTR